MSQRHGDRCCLTDKLASFCGSQAKLDAFAPNCVPAWILWVGYRTFITDDGLETFRVVATKNDSFAERKNCVEQFETTRQPAIRVDD